ncbi:hypothetical protein [Micromonospora zhanjiangensis]|uniref:Peptidase inhibitor family I36 n=1 Tax=Micromonospora zhanjiangensis TaxID=1522057 RepID=A0ABV8KTX8_9ACTN
MSATGLKARLAQVATATLLATTAALVVQPVAAQAADTCYTGAFCWYYLTNQSSTRGSQTQYTSGWARMSSLVDNSESSYNAQYADSHCVGQGRPYVYLSDTYLSARTTALVAISQGEKKNTFNPIGTDNGSKNMNNLFNDIWNACR